MNKEIEKKIEDICFKYGTGNGRCPKACPFSSYCWSDEMKNTTEEDYEAMANIGAKLGLWEV